MFRGDHPDLRQVMARGLAVALELGHPRCGSEHLLLALTAPLLDRFGVREDAVRDAVRRAGPLGAGVAADRDLLAPLGFSVSLDPSTVDRPPVREPLFPLGGAKARRRCAALTPPVGLDAQAAYEASLRLALARHEREHRPEHLALVLVAVDPGVAWVLDRAGVDRAALLGDLAAAYPIPRRNPLLRADRRLGRRSRQQDVIRRYERTTGRTATSGAALGLLIA
jgi:Clp amino terminal domain, pathogenicity island component